jgi:hypothetical protein
MAEQTTSLQPITVEEQELIALAESYKSLIVTPETLAEVDKARKVLKNKRLDIENTVKANKKSIKELLDNHLGEAERLVGIIKPIEERLLKEQTELKDKQEREAQAKIKAEEDRKRAIRAKVTLIENLTSEARKAAKKEEAFAIEDRFYSETDGFDFMEFSDEAKSVMDVFHSALESRMNYLREQEVKQSEEKVIAEPVTETNTNTAEKPVSELPRVAQLTVLGFAKQAHAWVRGEETIPFSVMDMPDDAWQALVRSKTPNAKLSPIVSRMMAGGDNKPVLQPKSGTELNMFNYKEFTFGLSKNIGMSTAVKIKKAIEEILG